MPSGRVQNRRCAIPCSGLLLVAAALLGLCGCRKASHAPSPPVHVAAAADLTFAFRELAKRYEDETGTRVSVTFGSTGLLEKQIAEGGPFDVFAAANVAFADDAIASGACVSDSKTLYATGVIVLFSAPGAAFVPHAIGDLADPRIRKIAIANPAHAPYGRAADQALHRAGLGNVTAPKLVFGENVQQALEFAQSGNADVAIVARSLATVTPGDWTPVSPELHDRIDQALVVCAHGPAGAEAGRRFAAFIMSAEGRATLSRFGFAPPNAESAADGGLGGDR